MRVDKSLKFLNVAKYMAQQFSKDQSTQVACIILDPDDYSVLSVGYNGFPRGCDDTDPAKHERPAKYLWTEHSERNAQYNMVRKFYKGGTVVTSTLPQMDDARALVSIGINKVILKNMDISHPEQEVTLKLFKEVGITPDVQPNHPDFVLAGDEGVVIMDAKGGNKIDGFWHKRFPEDPTNNSVEGPARDAIARFTYKSELLKGKAAVVTLMPCIDCASALAKGGVTTIISQAPDNPELRARWEENFNMSKKYLDNMGVNLIVFDADQNLISSNTKTIQDGMKLG